MSVASGAAEHRLKVRGSIAVAHGLKGPTACGILPN